MEMLDIRRNPDGDARTVRKLPSRPPRDGRILKSTVFHVASWKTTAALTSQERHGFDLFMGKAACGTCHFAPTFGGSLPPALLESEPEVIGVPSRPLTARATIDPDSGVAGFDHVPIHLRAFKTPSLRNAAVTAPYMHNGVYRTLDQVVHFDDRGGGAGIGIVFPTRPCRRSDCT